jgi:hypothetical protein
MDLGVSVSQNRGGFASLPSPPPSAFDVLSGPRRLVS